MKLSKKYNTNRHTHYEKYIKTTALILEGRKHYEKTKRNRKTQTDR